MKRASLPPSRPLHVGERITLRLESLASSGEAVARVDGMVVFVEQAVPGDEAEVEIVETRKTFARGRVRSVRVASPARTEPPCPIYAECGGCQLQHMTHEAQLEAKTRIVRDALRTIAGLPDACVAPCIATSPWEYRNKMQLVAAPGAALGLYRRRSHDVVTMRRCAIAHPLTNRILQEVTALLPQTGWPAWDERRATGLLRHVLARVAGPRDAPEALVVLVASSARLPHLQQFCEQLAARLPSVVGVSVNVNPDRTNVILGRHTTSVWGRDHLLEPVGDVHFRIGPTSFFQVNAEGLMRMNTLVADMLAPASDGLVIDAYCGVGALSLPLARRARQVIGIEENAEAVDNARANATLNDIGNARFLCGSVESLLPTLPAADAIILDPPRKGCEAAVVETIADHGVARVAYVSCNPATLARDVGRFMERGYQLTRVHPIDMFPQTAHVECVSLLERRKGETREAEKTPST